MRYIRPQSLLQYRLGRARRFWLHFLGRAYTSAWVAVIYLIAGLWLALAAWSTVFSLFIIFGD